MNTKVIKDWVDALRSGEYSQCQGQLTDGNNYCCLGVLCEILNKTNPDIITKSDISYNHCTFTLPNAVVEFVGLSSSNPSIKYQTEDRSLSSLNDRYKLTFNQIADLIEESFLK